RLSSVVEEQILAADPVLVLIDSVHATHEHKPGTARGAQTFFERLPVWLHEVPHCWGFCGSVALVAATSRYILLSSSFNEMSSRSSAAVGRACSPALAMFVRAAAPTAGARSDGLAMAASWRTM